MTLLKIDDMKSETNFYVSDFLLILHKKNKIKL